MNSRIGKIIDLGLSHKVFLPWLIQQAVLIGLLIGFRDDQPNWLKVWNGISTLLMFAFILLLLANTTALTIRFGKTRIRQRKVDKNVTQIIEDMIDQLPEPGPLRPMNKQALVHRQALVRAMNVLEISQPRQDKVTDWALSYDTSEDDVESFFEEFAGRARILDAAQRGKHEDESCSGL